MGVGNLPQGMTLEQLQQRWASILQPLLSSPLAVPLLLQDVSLTSGLNYVDHRLGRNLLGWFPIRFKGSFAQLYDTQSDNPYPSQTLLLNASAPVVVDLVVF